MAGQPEPEELDVRPAADGTLNDLASGAPTPDVTLDPYGVRVLELK